MVSRLRPLLIAVALVWAGAGSARAGAPFDLMGPTLEVKVTRGETTLPISEVPNLAVGDRVWIKADLPSTQTARYILVAAFLRGSTNPPPPRSFFRCDTWTRPCATDGLTVTVPRGAEQVLVFLAPKTGGDFKTLMGAVRGRPGAFVRASQDLNQAMLDRSRLDVYLAAIRALNDADPGRIKQVAPLLGRSLAIQVDAKCLDRIPELQAPCLMQNQDSLILDDGHSTTIVEELTSGPTADLAMQASYTPQLSYGFYSPYIASVLDIARILGSFSTAEYQYIPALASEQADRLALVLNTPPSFHDPKSVLVAALPAVEAPQPPPLHTVDAKEIFCARKTSLVLPVEGAPLVFSTRYAHEMKLQLAGAGGTAIELPAKVDPEQGGFVVDTSSEGVARLGDTIHASLRGEWGFETYEGPQFQLTNARSEQWELESGEDAPIVGRADTLHLRAGSISCIDNIMLRDPAGKELKVPWKTVKPTEVELNLPLEEVQPGAMTLLVNQYGAREPQRVALQAFSQAGHLDSFTIHAGDSQGILKGSRLDEVATLLVQGIAFVPGKLSSSFGSDALPMLAQDPTAAAALKEGASAHAKVTLRDGRVLKLDMTVDAPRPSVSLIGKSVLSAASGTSHISLVNEDELPQHAQLTFSVRAKSPAMFERDEQIEVATADESFATTLSLSTGAITLEDASVAVATLDPAKAFGPSAFGPLKFRVLADGTAGDWQPLATLVRLPLLKELQCPATPELACKLSGANLFLVDSVSIDPKFHHPVEVPDGFPGYALPVPHPVDGQLYVKLRDDPSVINLAAVGVDQLPPSPEEAAHAAARHAASTVGTLTSAATEESSGPPEPPPSGPPAAGAPVAPGALPRTPSAATSGTQPSPHAASQSPTPPQ
ncbi:MAG TPA: hypothetical protein VMD03_11125 [Steroidobacteraceae bacterium]|nr:hypothetical protein [Steroidobacteraceae bacterium]